MKKKSSKIVIILIFLAGLSLLLYPFIANQWNNHRQKQLIGNYESVISDKEAAGNIDYAAEMKKQKPITMHCFQAFCQTHLPWQMQVQRQTAVMKTV